MYRILVPIDWDDERTTAQTDMITRLPHAAESVHVTVLHVFSTPEEAASIDFTDAEAGDLLMERLAENNVSVELERRTGDPAEEILAVAEEYGIDMIVLGGRKRSPLGSLLFGSVTQAVIIDATRPVTVTGAESKQDPSHRCQSCGKVYYTTRDSEINKCQQCGGAEIEPIERVAQ